jgi:hypothetical protein
MVFCFGFSVRILAVKMAPVDVQKTTLITKSRLFDWTVMPFSIKNATNTFSGRNEWVIAYASKGL